MIVEYILIRLDLEAGEMSVRDLRLSLEHSAGEGRCLDMIPPASSHKATIL